MENIHIVGRVQEGIKQVYISRASLGIQNGQSLTNLRVAEAVGGRRKLLADPGIGGRIILVVTMSARPLQPAQKGIGKVVENYLLVFTDV